MTSPSASASMPRDGSEALSAAEVKRRKKMEYEEDEGPDDAALEIKRAVLEIPNIPTPRSSDGNVCIPLLCIRSSLIMLKTKLIYLTSIGLLRCRALLNSILSPSFARHTSVQIRQRVAKV